MINNDKIKNLITPELTSNEVKIYIALIENGESTAKTLSEQTDIKRPTVYLTLEQLHRKGLVSAIEEGKIKKYAASDPEYLREFFAQRIQALNKIMPELKWLSNRLSQKPTVRYFSGIEGAKSAYLETLEEPKSIIKSVGSIEGTTKLGQNFARKYIRGRIKKKIQASSILANTSFARELSRHNKEELRESMLINPELLPENTELNIFGHKVSFSSYGKQPLGIIIENQELAQILSTLYDLAQKKNKKFN
jgi:sugar-specific transcriptional regulator TrmB